MVRLEGIIDKPRAAVLIPAGAGVIHGLLAIPSRARAGVLILDEPGGHGIAGHVAACLSQRGIATLLTDALTSDEQNHLRAAAESRSNVQMIAGRLIAATDWLAASRELDLPRIGYFATGEGAAAALGAAVDRQGTVSAIVGYDARPLLAAPALPCVRAPTLFITDASKHALLKVNRVGFERLLCPKRLEVVVEGAPALEHVSRLVCDWFDEYLTAVAED